VVLLKQALQQLSEVAVDKAILKATGVGALANKIAKGGTDTELCDIAAELVAKWRRAVSTSKPANVASPSVSTEAPSVQSVASTCTSGTDAGSWPVLDTGSIALSEQDQEAQLESTPKQPRAVARRPSRAAPAILSSDASDSNFARPPQRAPEARAPAQAQPTHSVPPAGGEPMAATTFVVKPADTSRRVQVAPPAWVIDTGRSTPALVQQQVGRRSVPKGATGAVPGTGDEPMAATTKPADASQRVQVTPPAWVLDTGQDTKPALVQQTRQFCRRSMLTAPLAGLPEGAAAAAAAATPAGSAVALPRKISSTTPEDGVALEEAMAAALRWEGTANPRPTSSAENDAQGIRRALESTILDEKIAAKRQRTDSAPAEKVAPARPKVQRSTSSGSVSLTIDKKKREATQRAFLQALEPHIMESEIPKVKELCATIDEHLSFFFASNPQGYIDQARSIRFNLKDAHNLRFRTGVLANLTGCTTFSPEKLPKMSADDMASSEKLKQRETLRKEAAEEIQTDWAVRHGQLQASGTFWCGKCKKNKTTYFQMQTRSSDEPMTTFVTCLNCHNRWKFC